MAKIKTKGTALQLEIASVYTAIGQIISLSGPGGKSEDYQSDTLDNANAGIPRSLTGRSEGGSVSGEVYMDPVLASHQAITDLITTPAASSWKQIWADAATTEWEFDGAGISFEPAVALGDGLKASFEINVDGLVSYPT